MTAEADFSALLRRVADGAVLTADDAEKAFSAIMAGDVEPAQLAAFLTALKMRGEAADELTGAVQAVRRYMTVLPDVPRMPDGRRCTYCCKSPIHPLPERQRAAPRQQSEGRQYT